MVTLAPKEELEQLYGELKKAIAKQDNPRILKTANDVLKKYPEEEKAFHCKIISLINQDKHEDCLHLFKTHPQFTKQLIFEKAYCEYRLNRVAEAFATVSSSGVNDMRTQELLAQILYRMEKYEEAQQRYRQIIKNTADDSNVERQANLAAAIAAMHYMAGPNNSDLPASQLQDIPQDTHELVFNYATILIARKKFEEAEAKLKVAEEMCREYLSEEPDLTESEINDELAPMRVQRAYCLQMQGKSEEALAIYQEVIKQKPNDASVVAVAANNVVCINKDQNVFDSKKRIKIATADNLKQKLISKQSANIACNQCLLYLYTNQGDTCKRTTLAMQEWPAFKPGGALSNDGIHRPVLIYISQLLRERDFAKGIQVLTEYCTKNPTVIEVRLALAQLYLTQGAVSSCLAQLNLLPESILYQPAIISTMIALYENTENHDSASQHFTKALAYYASNKPVNVTLQAQLLKASAHYHLRHNMHEQAASLYEQLYKQFPGDQKILARLIHAYSQFDENKAKQFSKGLNLIGDTKGLDIDTLETTFMHSNKYTKKMEKAGGPSVATPDARATEVKKKKHRKKKGKLPKNIDPNVPEDPERWKPRRERSYYRGRKKDKRKDNIGRGPQGQTSASADIDKTSTPKAGGGPPNTGDTSNGPASPGGSASQAPKQPSKYNVKQNVKKKKAAKKR